MRVGPSEPSGAAAGRDHQAVVRQLLAVVEQHPTAVEVQADRRTPRSSVAPWLVGGSTCAVSSSRRRDLDSAGRL